VSHWVNKRSFRVRSALRPRSLHVGRASARHQLRELEMAETGLRGVGSEPLQSSPSHHRVRLQVRQAETSDKELQGNYVLRIIPDWSKPSQFRDDGIPPSKPRAVLRDAHQEHMTLTIKSLQMLASVGTAAALDRRVMQQTIVIDLGKVVRYEWTRSDK
jgi:hypothetical protein